MKFTPLILMLEKKRQAGLFSTKPAIVSARQGYVGTLSKQ